MSVTAQQLNRATLARQLLLERQPLDVPEAVRRLVALQAQHPASPYLALWNRLASFRPADVDAAVAGGTLVKATLMRITLHLVHAEDRWLMHTAMQPTLRASRLGDRRFTGAGLSPADADAVVPHLLEFLQDPHTNSEIEAWLESRSGSGSKGLWWALRSFAPLVHAPTGGPWSFRDRPAYVAAPDARPERWTGDPDECLPVLVRRYLQAFGPASVADVAQFALVPRTRARAALATLSDDVGTVEGPDGALLFDVPGAPLPAGDVPAPPRLLPMWDSLLLAYSDRSRVIPTRYRKLVTRSNGDVLPTVLVDGYVAGVWRPLEGGIEVTAFHPLARQVWDGVTSEASALTALLAERDPRVYRRYDHWWSTLPVSDVRVLP